VVREDREIYSEHNFAGLRDKKPKTPVLRPKRLISREVVPDPVQDQHLMSGMLQVVSPDHYESRS